MTEPRPQEKDEASPEHLPGEPEEYQRFERLARRVLSVPRAKRDRPPPQHA
jgi:hypothetical protein